MKEIGEKLREERLSIGISIDEAAEDLKMRPLQIQNIEEGNIEAFQDIFYLKYFIRDYSKYLGLDYNEMIDEFNEFLFDYTSKITIDDIKEAKKKYEKEEKKIKSPYTMETKPKINFMLICMYIVMFILVIIGLYFYFREGNDDFLEPNVLNIISKEGYYEFTK